MKMKQISKNKVAATISALLISAIGYSQDIHFSQYAEVQSSINPALAGSIYNTRAMANYRTQWGSVAKSYQTIGFSFEQTIGFKKLKGNYPTLFLNIFRDQAGDAKLRKLNPNIGLSQHVKINKNSKIGVGFQGGFIYKTIDLTNLRWGTQFDEESLSYNSNLPNGENNTPRSAITGYDFVVGANYSYAKSDRFISSRDGNKFNGGFSLNHFTIPKNSFIQTNEKLYTRINIHANADIAIPNSKNAVMPMLLIMMQGKSREFIGGALFKFILNDQSTFTKNNKPSAFAIGAQYRYRDAIIPSALYQFDAYSIGLSYDINVSALTPASKRFGGLEVMLRYNVSPGYGKNLGRSDTKSSY